MRPIPTLLTALVAAVVVAILMLVKLQAVLPPVKVPPPTALMAPDEELFIEPELMELGEPDAVTHDDPAPAVKGDPAPAPIEQPEVKQPSPDPKPVTPAPKTITQKKESPVKAPEPAGNDKEIKEATSSVANKFSSKNGNPSGNDNAGSAGVGGTGIGIAGSAHGRTFQGCPKPDVALRHKTIVKVNVVIDAEGRVIEAEATGSADASIRRKCEAAARQARWSAKKGATSTRGTLTFTIMPK